MIMNRCEKLYDRRYTRVLKENLPFPDLIIIDGGKGHIEASEMYWKMNLD